MGRSSCAAAGCLAVILSALPACRAGPVPAHREVVPDTVIATAGGAAVRGSAGSGVRRDDTRRRDDMAPPLTVTPPPLPPTGSWEPAGMTVLTERPFDAVQEDGWLPVDRNFAIVADPSAPRSGPSIGQVTYPEGWTGGGEPSRLEKNFGTPRFETIYASFWIRLSPNFLGHPTSGVNKILHFWINGGNRLYLSAQGPGTGALQPQVRLQGIPTDGGARNLTPNLVPGVQIVRGRWQRWELLARTNTEGQPNGLVEWWIDGVKVGSYSGVTLVTATERRTWELLQWAPTWGGLAGTIPATQYMWMDHLYVSGR